MSATIEAILLICAIVFSKLTIKIDGEILKACFTIGTHLQESVADGYCRMRTNSDSVGGTVGEFI